MQIKLRSYAALAAIVVAAACSDSATAPVASTRAHPVDVTAQSRPAFDYSTVGLFGTQSSDFTVTAAGGTFSVNGLLSVNFPANSVCDPSQSTYGDGQWDAPCVTLSGSNSVHVHATAVLTLHGLVVDFSPELRFAPTTNVTIWTDIFAPLIRLNRYYFAANPSALQPLIMSYSPSPGSSPVPDYASDPSLITHVDLSSGRIWRRVKHFSGYIMTSGQPCDPSPDNPDCIEVDNSPLTR